MRPRGYWGSLLVVGPIVLLLSILVWSLLYSMGPKTLGEAFVAGGWWMGLVFGAVLAPAMAFVVRKTTLTLPVQDRGAFVTDITNKLSAVGYRLESQQEDVLVFRPSARAGLLAPNVLVQIGDTSATVTGPRLQLKKLQKKV